jgi:hypothetical protein
MSRLVRSLGLALSVALSFWAPSARAAGEPRPKIDLVFAIDTTGSMGGLIQAAKTKVWSIVNQIGSGKPTPEIRVGLVAYRDRGDAYVTQVTEITPDLDAMYAKLMAFGADGGGDAPESVNQALSDAVTKMAWTREKRAMRLVFLVGDAPPHMDYPNDVKYPETCKLAARQGIIINAIRCGGDPETERAWEEIAHLAEGQYFSIAQGGGVAEVSTPFDAEIASADAALRATTMVYGRVQERSKVKKEMREVSEALAAAPAEAKADRAAFAARAPAAATAGAGRADLLRAVSDRSVDVEKLDRDELPEEMQKLNPAERRALVERKLGERQALEKKLSELSQKRAAFLAEAARKGKGDAFDARVTDAVRTEAARIGIAF